MTFPPPADGRLTAAACCIRLLRTRLLHRLLGGLSGLLHGRLGLGHRLRLLLALLRLSLLALLTLLRLTLRILGILRWTLFTLLRGSRWAVDRGVECIKSAGHPNLLLRSGWRGCGCSNGILLPWLGWLAGLSRLTD
jgi:hypothetical protein